MDLRVNGFEKSRLLKICTALFHPFCIEIRLYCDIASTLYVVVYIGVNGVQDWATIAYQTAISSLRSAVRLTSVTAAIWRGSPANVSAKPSRCSVADDESALTTALQTRSGDSAQT